MNSKIAIVARQELSLKLKSKVITISALFLILLAGASPWVSHLVSGKSQTIRVAVLEEAQFEYSQLKIATTGSKDTDNVEVIFITGKSKEEAIKGLKDGDYTLVLGKNGSKLDLLTNQNSSQVATAYLIRNLNQLNLQHYLSTHGISPEDMNSYLAKNTPTISKVSDNERKLDYSVALFALVLLYMILSLSGGLLALTIIEEKSGRIMEVLLSSISPRQLLLGKILGVLIFSILQFIAIATTWIVSSNLADSSLLHGVTTTQILFYLAWFIPAILSYSFIYGGLGALISRSEDAGAIQGPMSLLLIASVYGASYSLANPTGQLASIAIYIPPFNFFMAPAQYLSTGEMTQSLVFGYLVALLFTVVVIKGAVALFENNVLKNRRFTFKRALY